jgi:hypothetical protein
MKKHNGVFRLKWIALAWIVGFAPLILALRLLNNILRMDQAMVAFAAYLILPAVIVAGWSVVVLVGHLHTAGIPSTLLRGWADHLHQKVYGYGPVDKYGNR